MIQGTNGLFNVRSLPNSVCRLRRVGPQSVNSGQFTVSSAGTVSVYWGGTAVPGTYTVTVTCTAPDPDGRSATSGGITVVWQAAASS